MTDPTPTDDPIVSPTGSLIIGTEEKLTACAIANFRWENSTVLYDYQGTTECDWDNQRTLTTDDGEELLRDENGDTWPITQCMPRSHWQAKVKALDTYVFSYQREYTPERYLDYCKETGDPPTPEGWHDWVIDEIVDDARSIPDGCILSYVLRVPAATKAPN